MTGAPSSTSTSASGSGCSPDSQAPPLVHDLERLATRHIQSQRTKQTSGHTRSQNTNAPGPWASPWHHLGMRLNALPVAVRQYPGTSVPAPEAAAYIGIGIDIDV